ncbi:MAG: membrane integrity-associated transporter subunit PqiC [Aquabacterium sp.]
MNPSAAATTATALMCMLLASGCRTAPEPAMLTLPLPAAAPPAAAAPPSLAAHARPTLQVRRVAMPEHLLDRHVRFRLGAGTVVNWPDATWADRLDVSITEHLAMRLRTALPGWNVCVRHCPLQPGALTLRVELAPFDLLLPQGQLVADAHWWLDIPGAPGPRTQAGLLQHREAVTPPTAAAHAAAIGRLLDQLSGPIAAACAARLSSSEHEQRQENDDGQRNAQKP